MSRARKKPVLRVLPPPVEVPEWEAYDQGCCLRCGKRPPPLTECVMVLSWKKALDRGAGEEAQIGAYVLCDFCAVTIRKCLERGTRLVPIVLESQDDGGMYVHRESVVCATCGDHPPCVCGRAT